MPSKLESKFFIDLRPLCGFVREGTMSILFAAMVAVGHSD
jgi:hypothetical protein